MTDLTIQRVYLVEGEERVLIQYHGSSWSYPSHDVRCWARRLASLLQLDYLPEVAAKLLLTDRAMSPLKLQQLEIPPLDKPEPRDKPVGGRGRKADETNALVAQALDLLRSGFSVAEVALETGLGQSTLYRYQAQIQEAG